MRAIILGVFGCGMALAGPAMAQDSGFYVGAEAGGAFATEFGSVFTPGQGAGSEGNIETEFELGFAGSAFVGYDFGAVRVEVEAFTLSADVDSLNNDFPIPGTLVAGPQPGEGAVGVQGYFANAILEFGAYNDFAFFIGGGAGQASVDVEFRAQGFGNALDDDNEQFAWQMFGGVRKPLTSRIDGHIRYRYLSVDDLEMTGFGGRVVEGDLNAHSISAGLTYRF